MSLEYLPSMRIHPPRPQGAISPASLPRYKGFVAQYKYNDVRTIVRFSPPGRIELLNRYLQPHRFYSMTPEMRAALASLPLRKDRFHVLDGGLMHRIGAVRDRIVLWDILVHDSVYLVGMPLLRRYRLLRDICGDPKAPERDTGAQIALRVNSRLWLAPVFTQEFGPRFRDALGLDYLEGLVLKDPSARLERAYGENNNGSWQIRVRKPHLNYAF